MNIKIKLSTVSTSQPPPPTRAFVGWRVLHRSEGGRWTPEGQPCVLPSENAPPIDFERLMQKLAWNLAKKKNPLVTTNNFRSWYAGDTALCNFNGWDNPKDPLDLRADWVNMRDLTEPFPKLMKAIIFAGGFTTGSKVGSKIICVPGIDGIDVNKPLPSVDEVLERGWYTNAVIGWTNASKQWQIGHFGTKGIVYIPRFLKETVEYNAEWFVRWDEDYRPNPLTVYSPR